MDITPPDLGIALDPNITPDDIINAKEAGEQIPVSGVVSGEFHVGDTVTLTVNNKQFTGKVLDTEGHFTIDVPGSDLVADPDHTIDASITSTDAAGNSNTATDTEEYGVDVIIDLAIELDQSITADDIINAAEAGQQIPVSGTVDGDFKAGDIVTLTVNGKTFTGPVDADGRFTIDVAGSDLVADSDHIIDASVTSTDAAGNTLTATDDESYSVDTEVKDLAIKLDPNITPDDIINAAEAGKNIPVSGKVSGEFNVGDTVTLTVNGKEFPGKVLDKDGNFTIDVPGSALVADGQETPGDTTDDLIIDASVTSTDAVGNTLTATDTENYKVDTQVVGLKIVLDTEITADDIISATEKGEQIPVSGKVSGEFNVGDTVTLTVNGKEFPGKVLDTDGNFTINVPGSDLTADSDLTINASVTTTDVAGNTLTATDIEDYRVDVAIQLDADITADDIINMAERGQSIPVSGTVTGEFKAGDTVTLTVNGKFYQGPVDANGRFTIDVPGRVLEQDPDHIIDASVTSTDALGRSMTATDTEGYGVDVTGPNINIELDSDITPDDIINAAEAGQQIPVSGIVKGDFHVGDIVTLTVNGQNFTGEVLDTDGNFTIDVPGKDLVADPNITIDASVTSTDAAGNSDTATDTESYGVKVEVSIELLPIVIGDDNILNNDEFTANTSVTLHGTVGGDAKLGDTVTLTLADGSPLSTTVITLSNGQLGFSTTTTADKLVDGTSVRATITITDAAGNNSITASSTEGYGVEAEKDTTAPNAPTVTIVDDANNDGWISRTEVGDYNEWDPSKPNDDQVQLAIKVNAADFAAGGFVTVTIDQEEYGKTVNLTLNDDGTLTNDVGYPGQWHYDGNGTITYTQTSPNPDETISVTATQTDAAGNQSVEASDSATLKMPEGWYFQQVPKGLVAKMNFDDADVSEGNGTDKWSSDVAIKDISGMGVWATWGASGNGLIEVGDADIYGNAPYNDPDTHVAELGGHGAASQIYADIYCESDQRLTLNFDQGTGSDDADLGNSTVKVLLVQLDENDNPIPGTEMTVAEHTPDVSGWSHRVDTFDVPTSGKYRLYFETDADTDGHGPLLDNILVTEAPRDPYNQGIVGDPVRIIPMDAECPSSMKGTVQLSGFPAGTIVTDGAHTATIVEGQPLDATGWDLMSLSLTTNTVGDFTMNVDLTSTEPLTGDSVVRHEEIKVSVSAPVTVDNDVATDNAVEHDDSVLSVASDDHHPKTEHVSTADHASDPVLNAVHTANTVDPVNTEHTVDPVNTANTAETTNTVHAELGNHILCGTQGADLFVWGQQEKPAGTVTKDIVNDFNHNQGDKLDLSALLDNNGTQSHDDMKGLLSVFEKDDGVHLEVKDADTHSVTQEIVLADHSFDSLTGGMGSTATQVVDYMLNNHMLELHK
ncbi:MAG: Ig-like domain-containing protein [Aeromonas sp.]